MFIDKLVVRFARRIVNSAAIDIVLSNISKTSIRTGIPLKLLKFYSFQSNSPRLISRDVPIIRSSLSPNYTIKHSSKSSQRCPQSVNSSNCSLFSISTPASVLLNRYYSTQKSPNKDNNQGENSNKSIQKKQSFPLIKTRQEFVASSATSFLDSIKLNLKWLLIKQNRPFNTDDMSAFISWFVWSNILWFILGTTTFASILLYLSKYITEDENNETNFIDNLLLKLLFRHDSEKVSISFREKSLNDPNAETEDNIIPNIRDGVISLNNLRIQMNSKYSEQLKVDIFVQKMDLTLDFSKWYQGKGLINSVFIYGGSGVIENNMTEITEKYDDDVETYEYDNNERQKNEFNATEDKQYLQKMILPVIFNKNLDYEFGKIKVSNFKLVYSDVDDDYEEFNLQIFNLDLKKLRLKWFLFDLMKPQICSGTLNDALFSVHKKQLQTQSNMQLYFNNTSSNQQHKNKNTISDLTLPTNDSQIDTNDDDMNSITRIEINNINLKSNPLLKRSFNWLVDGKANITCDISIPSEKHFNINDLINEITNKVDVKFINKNIEQLVRSTKNELNNVSPFFDYDDFFNFNLGQVVGIPTNNPETKEANTSNAALVTSSDKYGNNYVFRVASSGEDSKALHNAINDKTHLKTPRNNKYIIFDLNIQFVNPIAAVPPILPYSRIKESTYMSYEDLKKLVAFVNQTAGDRSFFAKKSRSILSNFDGATTGRKGGNYTDKIISNDNTFSGSGKFFGLGSNENLELVDKQFTLKSSTIVNLDELYMKVSLTSETNIMDQCLDDLYEDLVKNLHHEMHTKFRFS